MLLAFLPVAIVDAAINKHVGSKTMLFVTLVITLVAATIVPSVDASPVHFVLPPLTLVGHPLRRVDQFAEPVQHVVLEVAHVYTTVTERHGAVRTLFPLSEKSLVRISVDTLLYSVALGHVCQQFPFIRHLDDTFGRFASHPAPTESFPIVEGTHDVDIRSHDGLDSLSLGRSIDEVAAVFVTIWPLYLAFAVGNQFIWGFACRVSPHLPRVEGSIWQNVLADWIRPAFPLDTSSDERLSYTIQGLVLHVPPDETTLHDSSEGGLQLDDRLQLCKLGLLGLWSKVLGRRVWGGFDTRSSVFKVEGLALFFFDGLACWAAPDKKV